MVQFSDTKEIILALKQVYKEKNLSIDKVLILVNNQLGEGTVSRSTIQAVFAEGSENGARQFGFSNVLKPLCVVLLDIEQIEETDSSDVRAYKSIMMIKKEIIEELTKANEQVKVDYALKLEDETMKFQKSLDFLRNQITLKDQRIDALMSLTTELMQTNNELLKQLMNCPLKNKDCKNEN